MLSKFTFSSRGPLSPVLPQAISQPCWPALLPLTTLAVNEWFRPERESSARLPRRTIRPALPVPFSPVWAQANVQLNALRVTEGRGKFPLKEDPQASVPPQTVRAPTPLY